MPAYGTSASPAKYGNSFHKYVCKIKTVRVVFHKPEQPPALPTAKPGFFHLFAAYRENLLTASVFKTALLEKIQPYVLHSHAEKQFSERIYTFPTG